MQALHAHFQLVQDQLDTLRVDLSRSNQEIARLRVEAARQSAELDELRHFKLVMAKSVSTALPGAPAISSDSMMGTASMHGSSIPAEGAKKTALASKRKPGARGVYVERVSATIKQHAALKDALVSNLRDRVVFVDMQEEASTAVWVMFTAGGRVDVSSAETAVRAFQGVTIGIVFAPGLVPILPPTGLFQHTFGLCLDDSFEALRQGHPETRSGFQELCGVLLNAR